ncbi:MAG: hypothetical protein SOI13_01575 [Bifidobacterium mongoliense]|jgi:hypothetical protein
MAGNGRRASKSTGETLKWDGVVRGLELPSCRPDGKEWLDLTKQYYYSFRVSPQAVKLGTDLDWYSVLDTCLLKDNFFRRPGGVLAAEIRARENAFGITPLARHALKWDAPSNDDLGAGSHGAANVVDAARRRDVRKMLGV